MQLNITKLLKLNFFITDFMSHTIFKLLKQFQENKTLLMFYIQIKMSILNHILGIEDLFRMQHLCETSSNYVPTTLI